VTPPAAAAVPSDVAALSFLLIPPRGPQTVRATNDAVQQGLVSAGYRVTTDATADVVLALNVALARERSFVTVNGRVVEQAKDTGPEVEQLEAQATTLRREVSNLTYPPSFTHSE
jgi:hypothetical protein